MDRLDSLALFLRIVEKGGLAAAGRDFGLSPAAVTERLAGLEAHYGARLLNRTTRAISLTDEGRLLQEGARDLVNEAGDLEARVRHGVEQLSGPVRISAPLDLGRHRVVQMLDRFMAEHPEVGIELTLSDSYVDLVAQGIDLGIRFGDLKDSSLRTRRLGLSRRLVCAAPSYLERFGTPKHPDELAGHNCLLMRFGVTIDQEWPFMIGGKRRLFFVRGNRQANDGSLVRHWCLEGHGIALKAIWDVREDLAAGRLVELLAGFEQPPSSLQVIYPGGRNLPKRVRALIDFLVEAFADEKIPKGVWA
ncbi:LysR family transcriptional regulator [Pelagibius sp. Alg239-R121]|uniref:LysR family transcriptional regulator n=1 Tax=Pelagibius sp. Alg239-R121 TaxID=2993448 RepID=UPI0024A6658D|nr:LysR family transcriptional regulator [Pelagibius sp. Alg239-R121]